MKTRPGIVLLMMAFGCTAFAGPAQTASLASLKGRFGFNWYNSASKEKCVRVDDKLLKDFQKNYQCDLEEKSNSASGKPQVACTRKDNSKQYVIFKTKALCEEERETQMANSEE
jgi:hypothetical protein